MTNAEADLEWYRTRLTDAKLALGETSSGNTNDDGIRGMIALYERTIRDLEHMNDKAKP